MTLGSKARPFIPEWGKRGRGVQGSSTNFQIRSHEVAFAFHFFRLGKEAVRDQ